MRTVEPIKQIDQLEEMKRILHKRSTRDYCLFLLGINTGMRIHDLIHIRVDQLRNQYGEFYSYLQTSSYFDPPIYCTESLRTIINQVIEESDLNRDDFLFKSRKSSAPITRQQAYRIIHFAAKEAGIDEPIGMHTLRKTFGYHAYINGIAISLIQKRLQHQTTTETRHYIGISTVNSAIIKLNINL
ncbi:tyrosine-type recombinase/integrase [Paraliobacillus sediminis]|uniref:tyrosine-type recombinase/integrase n=1 Tax=Paraliobacillus sediminis TaxID=1885916 RepID=UPI000E3C2944|nr:tyrosine-type recombinase/integrase [Paraliobacillus sediminis]